MKSHNVHHLLQDSILTNEPLIHPHLAVPPKGNLADRVAIYADGFYSRLEETLTSDYLTLSELLGESFHVLCKQYIDSYPSHTYSLNFFGGGLATLLNETQSYCNKPWLAEIASFEWAESQAIIAADATLLTAAELQALPTHQWPQQIFYLHPSSTLLTMHWNSLSIIEAIRHDHGVPKARKLKKPQSILIWRRQQDVRYCRLNQLEQQFIDAIKNEGTFLDLCECLGSNMSEKKTAHYLVSELQAWLVEELFVHKSLK